MRVHANRERCASSGMCALTAPQMFRQDPDDGRVLLLRAVPEAAEEGVAVKAVSLCPSGALSRHED